jgi:hypothetical protein
MNNSRLTSIPAYRPHVLGAVRVYTPLGAGGDHYHTTTRNPAAEDPMWVPALRNGARALEAARIAAIMAVVDARDLSAEDKAASLAESARDGKRGRGRPRKEKI